MVLPAILFLGSGAIDTILKFVEINYVKENEVSLFSGSLFGFAALFGLLILGFKNHSKKRGILELKMSLQELY